MEPRPIPVKITADAAGRGTVEVDGHDLTENVAGVQIVCGLGVNTSVILTLGQVELEVEISGTVAFRDGSDPEGLHAAFDAIDPDEVERVALANAGFGDKGTALVIEEVRRLVAGTR